MPRTALTPREEAANLLAQQLFGAGFYMAAPTEDRLFIDDLLDRVEQTYARHVPQERIDAEHAARVVAHRQAQATFSVAIPANLIGAVQRAVEGVVEAHRRHRIPANQYTLETGDAVVTISRAMVLPPSMLLPVVGAGDPRD